MKNRGWFSSIGFSRNRAYNLLSEVQLNGSTDWVEIPNDPDETPRTKGDLHIGFGYKLPLANKLTLVIRGGYAVGVIFDNVRRNALSISAGLGWSFLGRS